MNDFGLTGLNRIGFKSGSSKGDLDCLVLPKFTEDIGAAIASARIHLSDEIYLMQQELKNNIEFTNELLQQSDLPVLSDPLAPIYFIAIGQLRLGRNMIDRILNEGYYVNLALFPTVPIKNTGLRFTITRHHTKEYIKDPYFLILMIKINLFSHRFYLEIIIYLLNF